MNIYSSSLTLGLLVVVLVFALFICVIICVEGGCGGVSFMDCDCLPTSFACYRWILIVREQCAGLLSLARVRYDALCVHKASVTVHARHIIYVYIYIYKYGRLYV